MICPALVSLLQREHHFQCKKTMQLVNCCHFISHCCCNHNLSYTQRAPSGSNSSVGCASGWRSESCSFPVLFAFLLPSITLFFFTLVDLWLQFQGLSPDSEDCHTNFTTHFQDYLLNARMLTSFVALMFV